MHCCLCGGWAQPPLESVNNTTDRTGSTRRVPRLLVQLPLRKDTHQSLRRCFESKISSLTQESNPHARRGIRAHVPTYKTGHMVTKCKCSISTCTACEHAQMRLQTRIQSSLPRRRSSAGHSFFSQTASQVSFFLSSKSICWDATWYKAVQLSRSQIRVIECHGRTEKKGSEMQQALKHGIGSVSQLSTPSV